MGWFFYRESAMGRKREVRGDGEAGWDWQVGEGTKKWASGKVFWWGRERATVAQAI
jgi:hypothetical protein